MERKIFVNLENARVKEQADVMREIARRGICPFCQENIKPGDIRPTIKETSYWLLVENHWPYENTRVHLLLISKPHLETISQLSQEAWADLLELFRWVEKEYQLEGGCLGIRFGNLEFNGGSVKHLHVHVITPLLTDKDNPNYQPVRLRVG